MSKSQDRKDVTLEELITALKQDPDILICGPCESDQNHMRVYVHGGNMCKLPIKKKSTGAEVLLLDMNYFKEKYNPSATLEQEARDAKSSRAGNGQKKVDFVYNHKDELKEIILQKFNGRERDQQTAIALRHRTWADGRTVVFDIESAVSKDAYKDAAGIEKGKIPNFDIAALSVPEQGKQEWILWIIEYKCSGGTCTNESGIAVHAEDMTVLNSTDLAEKVKEELLDRIARLCSEQFAIFPESVGKALPKPERVQLKKAFLFTSGEGLKDQKTTVKICREEFEKVLERDLERDLEIELSKESREKFGENFHDDERYKKQFKDQLGKKLRELHEKEHGEQLENRLGGFYYLFCEKPENVDLSKFQTWDEFSK